MAASNGNPWFPGKDKHWVNNETASCNCNKFYKTQCKMLRKCISGTHGLVLIAGKVFPGKWQVN